MHKTGIQTALTFTGSAGELHYLRFLPQGYGQQEEAWPLIVFLHGLGQRGDSQESLDPIRSYGPSMIVEQEPEYPAVVLSPQCPTDAYWPEKVDVLDELIAAALLELHVDPARVYMTGLSMGGYGTWHYGLRYPGRCAALAPIAGGYIHESREIPENLCALKDTPIWAFHGTADDVVEPYQTEILVEALRACGSDIRYTSITGADHRGSWETAYADPELWSWLLARRKEHA